MYRIGISKCLTVFAPVGQLTSGGQSKPGRTFARTIMQSAQFLKDNGLQTVGEVRGLSKTKVNSLCEPLSQRDRTTLLTFMAAADESKEDDKCHLSKSNIVGLRRDETAVTSTTALEDVFRISIPADQFVLLDVFGKPSCGLNSRSSEAPGARPTSLAESAENDIADLIHNGQCPAISDFGVHTDTNDVTLVLRGNLPDSVFETYQERIKANCPDLNGFHFIRGPNSGKEIGVEDEGDGSSCVIMYERVNSLFAFTGSVSWT